MILRASYQREIDRFCKQLMGGEFNVRQFTKGALTQARAKLNPWAFKRLTQIAVDIFYEEAEYYTWKDLRVLAVDGSRLRLPNSPDIVAEFGEHGFGPNADSLASLATCSILFDVLNNVVIDSCIGPYEQSETQQLLEGHIQFVQKGDVLMADRGYPSYRVMLEVLARGAHFCFRMQNDWWNAVRDFNASGEKQRIEKWPISARVKKELSTPTDQDFITVRLIKIELENGEIEILCTSLLDEQKYEYEQFEALYHRRWGVEEEFKLLKARVEVEAFSGKTAKSVKQDFHAKMYMMTLYAVLCFPVMDKVKKEYDKEKTGNKHSQQINHTHALSVVKDNLVNFFLKNIYYKVLNILDFLVELTREIIRPGRNFERKKKPKRQYHTTYKPL